MPRPHPAVGGRPYSRAAAEQSGGWTDGATTQSGADHSTSNRLPGRHDPPSAFAAPTHDAMMRMLEWCNVVTRSSYLILHASLLFFWVIELRVGIAELTRVDYELKPLSSVFLLAPFHGQDSRLGRSFVPVLGGFAPVDSCIWDDASGTLAVPV